MFELFLMLCFITETSYECEVVEGYQHYQVIYNEIDKQQPGISDKLYQKVYDEIDFYTEEQRECETKGSITASTLILLNSGFNEVDFVCIKKTAEDSEIKARLHFELENVN